MKNFFPTAVLLLLCACPSVVQAQDWHQLNEDGLAHYKSGKFAEAVSLFDRAIYVARRSKQPGDELVSLTNAGHTHQALANYKEAQNTFRRALRVSLSLHPKIHFEQLEAVLNLSNAFLPEGKYDSCEHYAMIADEWLGIAIRENSRHYQEEVFHFFDASIKLHNTLASLAHQKGQHKKAAALMEQQKKYIRGMYPDSFRRLPAYHSTLNNLATYYITLGDFARAKAVCLEDISLFEADETSLPYLHALNNLGSVYRNLQKPDSATLAYRKAEAIINRGFFQGTDLHVSLISNLGDVLFIAEDYPQAIEAFKRSVDVQESRAGINPRVYKTTLLNLAEAQYWSGNFASAEMTFKKLTDALSDEIRHYYTYLSDEEKISFFRSNATIVETYSSFAFQLSGDMKLGVGKDGHISPDGLRQLYDLLLLTKGLILNPTLRIKSSILQSTDDPLKAKYKLWEQKKYEYAHMARQENVGRDELGALLYEIENLEKWLRTRSREFEKGFIIPRQSWRMIQQSLKQDEAVVEVVRLADGLVYGALILTASTRDVPAVALVKSKYPNLLERQYYKHYANSIQYNSQDTLSYDVFWAPIEETIRKHLPRGASLRRVYLSADGVYHKINVQTLYNKKTGRYVIADLDIALITNSADLLQTPTEENRSDKSAALFGRPQFDIDGKTSSLKLKDLPGTEKEVDEIDSVLRHARWKSTLYKSLEATEGTVKLLQRPTVLHFATHGFVSNDTLHHDLPGIMINSGVALTGAGVRNFSAREDGILTAYELMNLDLDHTRLVVLSACETGLGEFYSGEGVYGLQRALRSAGAKSVIMSLWKVDDTASQQLMRNFYIRWISNKEDLSSALRKAQLELMTTYPQPKHWGAFVLSGR